MAIKYESGAINISARVNGVQIANPHPYGKIEMYLTNWTYGNPYSCWNDPTNTSDSPIIYYTANWGDKYEVTVTAFDGYKFVGACSNALYEGDVYVDPLSGTHKKGGATCISLEFYTLHTISYNANGGENAPEQQIIGFSLSTPLTNEIPKRKGYKFVNWYCETTNMYYLPEENITIYKDITLYAMWEANTYTITLDGNGGTTTVNSLEVAYETTQNNDVSQYIPQRQAYEFLGWYSSPTGGVQVYDANGLCTNDGTYWLNDVCVHTEDYTLYAQWKALNIAYYKHEGEWKLCRTYIKVDNTWKPAIMYIKSKNKYIR